MDEAARAGAWILTALTVLAEMAYPLVGSDAKAPLTIVTVGLFFFASLLHSLRTRGIAWSALVLGVTAVGGLLVEAVGVSTGVPFGRYHYTSALGPALLSVPVIIPLAWTMMAYPAYVVAVRLCRNRIARVAVGAWALASWDVFLDPQMVAAGYWHWRHPAVTLPGVPTVPLTNYAGWFLVALVMMTVLVATEPPASARPRHDAAPIVLYLWTYLSSVLAHAAFFRLPWSAAWGAGLMGAVAIPLLVSLRLRRSACGP